MNIVQLQWDSWESLGLQGYPTSPFWRRSVLNIHWKDWCWIWSANTLATWCEELTHLLQSMDWIRQDWVTELKWTQFQFSHSVVSDSVTPRTAAHQASLSITNSQSLLKLMSNDSVMPSNHRIFCHPLLLPLSFFPSIRVSSNESVLHIRWPKYWRFSFNISPSNEDSGLISFRMDCLGLFAIQGTLKSLLQHNSSKASILQHSAFFIVQLSHLYITTGKTIALTRWAFVGKVMSLLFNILSRLVITFLSRS